MAMACWVISERLPSSPVGDCCALVAYERPQARKAPRSKATRGSLGLTQLTNMFCCLSIRSPWPHFPSLERAGLHLQRVDRGDEGVVRREVHGVCGYDRIRRLKRCVRLV